jgi:hypothetical protein
MRNHNGMRPHDIAILLKIVSLGERKWYMKSLAFSLGISAGEISESLNRSKLAGLIGFDLKSIDFSALLNFLKYGLPFTFPKFPGPLVRGLPAAYSAKPVKKHFKNTQSLVWPYPKGTVKGQALDPLYFNLPKACQRDEKFYELVALSDVLRVGNTTEKETAFELLLKNPSFKKAEPVA